MARDVIDPDLVAEAKKFLKKFPKAGNEGVEDGLVLVCIRKGWLDRDDDCVLADCYRQEVIDASIVAARDELEIPEPDLPTHLAFALDYFKSNRRATDARCREAWTEAYLGYLGKSDYDYENDRIDSINSETLIAARQKLGLKLDRDTVKLLAGRYVDSLVHFICDKLLHGKATDAQILRALERDIKKGKVSNSSGVEYSISLDDIAVIREYVAEHPSEMQALYSTFKIRQLIEKERKRRIAKSRPAQKK